MKFPRLVSLLLAGLLPVAGLFGAEPALTKLVPADAAVVFEVRSVPALRTRIEASPWGRAWADPDVVRFFAPLKANPKFIEFTEQIKTETGYTAEELLAFVTGDLLLTIPSSTLGIKGDEPDVDVFIALEVGENEAKLRELITAAQAKASPEPGVLSTEDYNGVVIHTEQEPAGKDEDGEPTEPGEPFIWALHQGRWFLTTNRELLVSALDALAAGGHADSLARSADYVAVLDRAGGNPDLLGYLNWKAVYPVVVAAVEASRDPSEPPNPLGVDPSNILKALGLDAIQSVSFSSRIGETSTTADFVLSYSESRGVINLITYRDGPVAKPDWVPAAWFNVSSQNLSLPAFYAELQTLFTRISPLFANVVTGKIKEADQNLQINIERDLIGSFGDSVLSGYALPAGASENALPSHDELDQFFAISLKDPAAFERTIETVKAKFLPPEGGPLKKREYLGRTLYVFTPPAQAPGARGVSYAITDGWFLLGVGSPAVLESVLQGMNTPQPGFWQRAEVRAALDPLPPESFSIQYADLRYILSSACAMFVKLQAAESDEPEERFVDPAALPGIEVFARYFSHVVTHGKRTGDALVMHSESPHP